MSQVSEQQKTSEVKYHELKRPLTKREKQEIRWDGQSYDYKLRDKFDTDLFLALPIVCCAASVGAMGIGMAHTATTIGGALLSFGATVGGIGGGLLFVGKLGYDTFRYFSDRHKRIQALEQEKIEANTQKDSQELQRVREDAMKEAEETRGKLNKHIAQVAERRKAALANGAPVRKAPTTRVSSRNGKIFIQRKTPQAGD